MKINILWILFLLTITVSAQTNRKIVRLSDEKEAWLAGDRQKALELLLEKEKSGDLDISTLYNIGYLYFLLGNQSQAILYLQTVIVRAPSFPYAYLQIARIHKQYGNLHAARDHIEKGLDENSENLALLLELAEIRKALKDIESTQETYEEILDIDDDNITATAGLAAVHRGHGKYEEAQELLAERPEIYPEGLILLERSKLYRALGDNNKSVQSLLQILREYPNSSSWAGIRDSLKFHHSIENIPELEPLPTYSYRIDLSEELDYKVKYGPMTLGWLKVRFKDPEMLNGKQVHPIIFFVDTNPDYGFIISFHHIYESYIDPETMNAVKSRLYTPENDQYMIRTYYYRYDQNLFESYTIDGEGYFNYIVKDLPRKIQDATSILFLARGLVSDKISGTTPVVIDEEFKVSQIKFLNETEQIDIDEKLYNTVKIFARVDFKGIAGMSGDGWGWFSTDGQVKPIKGSFEIIIGSIIIEVDEEKTEVPDFHIKDEDD